MLNLGYINPREMSPYNEGLIAIGICLTVLNVAIIGIAMYYVHRKTERSKEQGVKIMFLVDNLIEILNNKYDKDESSGDIPRRE